MSLDRARDFLKRLVSPEIGTEPVGHAPELAAAALMFEIAWADHDIGDEELLRMRDALTQIFSLDEAEAATMVEESRALHDASVGLHEFCRVLNDELDQEAKYEIVLALWRIAFADDDVLALEEHLVRRAAELLYVPHSRFIEAKRAVRAEPR